MNIENNQGKCASYSIGKCLRLAREKMNLTQQNVAEKLCLKLYIIECIENDELFTDLSSVFLRGYVRSYAKLVNIPEEDLTLLINKQPSLFINKVHHIKNLSLRSKEKKRDTFLIICTILIIIIIISFTIILWFQKHNFFINDSKLIKIEENNKYIYNKNYTKENDKINTSQKTKKNEKIDNLK